MNTVGELHIPALTAELKACQEREKVFVNILHHVLSKHGPIEINESELKGDAIYSKEVSFHFNKEKGTVVISSKD